MSRGINKSALDDNNDDVFVMVKNEKQKAKSGHFVMVDPAHVSVSLAPYIELFQIEENHVGKRIIVGYCIDLETYKRYIGQPSLARLVQLIPSCGDDKVQVGF